MDITRRSIGLLDALAALCINEPRKQVLAVSLSLTTEGSILCIAARDGVAPEVALHLHGIFTRLKNLRSSLHHYSRKGMTKPTLLNLIKVPPQSL
jgi:hypothetical protein